MHQDSGAIEGAGLPASKLVRQISQGVPDVDNLARRQIGSDGGGEHGIAEFGDKHLEDRLLERSRGKPPACGVGADAGSIEFGLQPVDRAEREIALEDARDQCCFLGHRDEGAASAR